MNKYNVRAIRKELDDCIRHHSWNKFRSKLSELKTKPKLYQAVLLFSANYSKLFFNFIYGGSLLHALVKVKNFPLDIATDMASAFPSALTTTDSNRQTPLHIALNRQQQHAFLNEILQTFLEMNASCLNMTDKYGDTPLMHAARFDYDFSHLKLLLRYDSQHTTCLISSKRKERLPLWYVASNDLQLIHSGYSELPENLQLLLLETYFALERQKTGGTLLEEDDKTGWDTHVQELHSQQSSTTITSQSTTTTSSEGQERNICLLLRAFVACIDPLGKYAVKIMEFFLERDTYEHVIVHQTIDRAGNYLLHRLCTCTDRSDEATHNILLEQLLRHPQVAELQLHRPNAQGNLPLHLAVQSNNESFVTQLLPLYTTTTDALSHLNALGELPLHISLKQQHSNVSLSRDLWTKYPTAAQVMDGPTQLYPFVLAALSAAATAITPPTQNDSTNNRIAGGSSSSSSSEDDVDNLSWLSFIYDLLIAAPQVLGDSLDVESI